MIVSRYVLMTAPIALSFLLGCQKRHSSSPNPVEQSPSPPPATVALQPSADGKGKTDEPLQKTPVPLPAPIQPPTKADLPHSSEGIYFQQACSIPESHPGQQTEAEALRLMIRLQESLAEDTSCDALAAILQKQPALVLSSLSGDASPLGLRLRTKVQALSQLDLLGDLAALTELTVIGTKISNLDSLKDLKLTSLTMHHQVLSDIRSLASLSSLTELRLGGAKVSEPIGLSALTNLKTLIMVDNDFTTLAPLKMADSVTHPKLTHLIEANLSHNHLSSVDGIENVPNLASLTLDGNHVGSLDGLQRLSFLQRLSIQNNDVSSLTIVHEFKALIDLDLALNHLADLRSLQNHDEKPLSGLARLNLSGNPLTSLDGIDMMPELTSLSLDSTLGPNLGPLKSLHKLTALSLKSAGINSLEVLGGIETLHSLDISDNAQIKDISPLARLPLVNLSLAGTALANNDTTTATIAGGGLPKLRTLDLRRTGFDHFDRLMQLKLATNRARPLADCTLFQAHHGLAIEVDQGSQIEQCDAVAAGADNQYICYEYDPTGQTPPVATPTRYLSCWTPSATVPEPPNQDHWKDL